jgi:choline dehydrogenase-like flavoprotein
MSHDLNADVVIVGAGVAGGIAAHALASAGVKVALLEAGPRLDRWEIVERFRGAVKKDFMAPYPFAAHAPHPMVTNDTYLVQKGPQPYDTQYIRAVGGTTWHWAAAAWRLLPSDFKLKSLYGVGRDWAIDYNEIEPYYQRAETELGVSGEGDVGSPRANPYPMPKIPLSYMDQRFMDVLNANGFNVVVEPVARNSATYDDRPPCCGNNNCMPICPIGAQYSGNMHVEKAETAGAQLIPDAVVFRIEAGPDRTIRAVHYKDPGGVEHRVAGRIFILAANGIETPKLMLMSVDKAFPNGIGNSSDMVGRNLMDHPGTQVSFLANEPLWPGRGPQEMTSVVNFRDGDFRRQYAAKKLHLSNAIHNDDIARRLLEKRIIGSQLDRDIRSQAARQLTINSFHEHLPEPQNRIVPSRDYRDAIGIPQPEITYSLNDYVRESAKHTHEVYDQIAKLFGGTEIVHNDDFGHNNHMMGTVIMGTNPKDSVVDGDCRCHDHPNLFVAGSAVFPSAGAVNPTLTIAALSLRMADKIRNELRGT